MKNVYEEEFVKNNVNKEDVSYVINQIRLSHPIELGWTVSDPIITSASKNKVDLVFQLIKQKTNGRSIWVPSIILNYKNRLYYGI